MHDIAKFIAGFRRFQRKYFCDDHQLFDELRQGQRPNVLVVSCCDSRVDPTLLWRCEPGELFVVRNVAGLVPPYQPDPGLHGVSAAVEYAVTCLEVDHIIVLGHSFCGGIKALLRGDEGERAGEFVGKWVGIAAKARDETLSSLADKNENLRQRACELAAILVS